MKKTDQEAHADDVDLSLIKQLEADNAFGKSRIQYNLFAYLYEHSLKKKEVSEYSIALDVLGKSEDFDPSIDSSVRANISRLRKNISLYNAKTGDGKNFKISFPLGTYDITVTPTQKDEKTSAGNLANNKKFWLIFASIAAFVIFGGLFASKVFNSNSENQNTASTITGLSTGSVFPTVHAYIDNETLAEDDRTEATVVFRYLENLFNGLNLLEYTSRDRAEYLLRLNYLPDQIILQLYHKDGEIIWSSDYERPTSDDNETLKTLATKMLTGLITTEDPLGSYHAKNTAIESKLRDQYRCISDLYTSTMTLTDVTELEGDYANVKDLIACVKDKDLVTPKEKSAAYSLVAHHHVRDYLRNTNETTDNDPAVMARAAFDKAKAEDPNLQLYLRLRLNFEQKSKEFDEAEFHELLGALQSKYPNDYGITVQRAQAHGYYLNEWDKALNLYASVFGELTYSDFVNGQPRLMNTSETIPMMGFIMKNDYDMAYKALRYRAPVKSSSMLGVEVALHCLTGNQDGMNQMPESYSRSLSAYLKVLDAMNYHSEVDAKLRSITEGDVCSFFTEP